MNLQLAGNSLLAYNLVLDKGLGPVCADVFLFLVLEHSHTIAFLPVVFIGGNERDEVFVNNEGQGSRP